MKQKQSRASFYKSGSRAISRRKSRSEIYYRVQENTSQFNANQIKYQFDFQFRSSPKKKPCFMMNFQDRRGFPISVVGSLSALKREKISASFPNP